MIKTAVCCLLLIFIPVKIVSQKMPNDHKLDIKHIAKDIAVTDLQNAMSTNAKTVAVDAYWNGMKAPKERSFTVRLLWSESALYALFETAQGEEPVIAEKPDLTKKAMNLWDRDVVEIFIAPHMNEPRKYFEFEAAPTGEWLDVALNLTTGKRVSDWEYASGMETVADVEVGRVTIALKIPWTAFGKKPEAGDVWLGNIFRCVGKDPNRGYLAWRPTMTAKPNFHVPERFGEFHFVK